MKTTLLALALIFLTTAAYSQVKTDPASQGMYTPEQEQLLTESKTQKRIGMILLMGGVGLVTAGAATYEANFGPLWGTPVEENDNTLSGTLAVAGLFSIIGGLTQLAAAKSSKEKALSVVIHQERMPIRQQGAFTLKATPTVGFQIAF